MAATPPAAPTTIPTSAPKNNEIDPELISLKRKHASIGPVLAEAILTERERRKQAEETSKSRAPNTSNDQVK